MQIYKNLYTFAIMRANIEFLRERFMHFNRSCFEGKLPAVTLRISSSLRTLGTLRHPRRPSEAVRPAEIVLSISNRLDLETGVVEDTIIHEMIHLYIYCNGIRDTSTHGLEFRKIAHYINRRHGRNITISHRGSDEEKKTDRIRKPRVVITSYLNGEKCVTVCSPRYTLAIYKALKGSKQVRNIEIMATSDPVFAQYPASRTPKLYRIDSYKLEQARQQAVFYQYNNGKFEVIPAVR